MTRRVVEVRGRTYTFSLDDPVPLAGRTWAVVSAWVIDEMTGEPPRSRVTVNTDMPGLTPHVASDGLAGLVGIPGQVFPYLATQSYQVNLTFMAEGYIPRHEEVTIAQNVDFPNAFDPARTDDILMHRKPIMMQGRTVSANGSTTTPTSGATVRITGVWRTLPPADATVPAAPPNLVSLQPPLYFTRPAPIGRLRRKDMMPVVGEDKHLLDIVRKGSNLLRLSDRVNLAPGDIVVIDAANPDLMEYLTVDTISGASAADQPADITLVHPVAHPHRSNTVIRKVIPQALGSDNPFDQDAIAGDPCVLLASMNDLDLASVVEISGGSDPVEYHSLHLFSVNSDADGYYRLPPLSRVAQLEIEAVHGGQTITQTISPNYTCRENRIDFVFR